MQGIEDTSILEDLAEAEEAYDKPDQVCMRCPSKYSHMCIPFDSRGLHILFYHEQNLTFASCKAKHL